MRYRIQDTLISGLENFNYTTKYKKKSTIYKHMDNTCIKYKFKSSVL